MAHWRAPDWGAGRGWACHAAGPGVCVDAQVAGEDHHGLGHRRVAPTLLDLRRRPSPATDEVGDDEAERAVMVPRAEVQDLVCWNLGRSQATSPTLNLAFQEHMGGRPQINMMVCNLSRAA